MKKTIVCFIFLIFLLPLFPVWAQFYQWTDKNGVKHFTDNILEVPKDQRPQVTVHKGVTPKQPVQKPAAPATEEDSDLEPDGESLLVQKAQLEQESAILEKKRRELIEQQDALPITKYNAQVNALNKAFLDFQQKLSVYEQKVKKYNQQQTGKPEGPEDQQDEAAEDTQ
jgi:hypothetical protein